GIPAAPHPAAQPVVGPPRHRRGRSRALQRLSRADPGGLPPRAAVGGAAMAQVDIQVPDIGDFKGVSVIEVLVKPGDVIQKEQSLITVESDKASMEIPSSHAGTVRQLKVKLGDTVSEGSVIL